MNFIAGSSYASFERIRHMHIRHHVERADVTCFEALEWAYIPATELLMHAQVVWRPFFCSAQRRHLPRARANAGAARVAADAAGASVLQGAAALLRGAAVVPAGAGLFDAFHHTFDQYFVAADQALPASGRDRHYENANTYSNLVSRRYPVLNLLILNFGYHNAHHERASVPWYRLPALHRQVVWLGDAGGSAAGGAASNLAIATACAACSDDYGGPGQGPGRADRVVGAHGVSVLLYGGLKRWLHRPIPLRRSRGLLVPASRWRACVPWSPERRGGIGNAIVRELIAQGATVQGLDLDAAGLNRTALEFGSGSFVPHTVDLADRAAVDRMLADLLAGLRDAGDILVNNAGVSRLRSLENTDDTLLDCCSR